MVTHRHSVPMLRERGKKELELVKKKKMILMVFEFYPRPEI